MRRALITVAALCMGVILLPLAGCDGGPTEVERPPAESVVLEVSAATSLRQVLESIAPAFEEANRVKLIFNFGASGQLQRQIEGGAPADIFVSASPKQVDALVSAGLASTAATSTFARNDLVIFVPRGNPADIQGPNDLAGAASLTTGNPDTAPHGAKAKEWLGRLGLWGALRSRFVFAENAAQTLDYVARGEVDAGIGFGSEAVASANVERVYTVPRDEVAPVRYVATVLRDTDQPDTAASFVEYLSTPDVQRALVDAGFLPAPEVGP